MYQDYSVSGCLKFLCDRDRLQHLLKTDGTFRGSIIEYMSAFYDGHKHIPGNGPYDQLDESINNRIEVKSTSIPQGNKLRVGGFTNKRSKFDYIKIIDAVNNRVAMIPHDIFFNYVGDSGEFHWSVSYNKMDKVKPAGTQLFLKYEVTNAK